MKMKDFHLMKTKDNDKGSHQITEPIGVHDLSKQARSKTNEEENNRNTGNKTKGFQQAMPANFFPEQSDSLFLITS